MQDNAPGSLRLLVVEDHVALAENVFDYLGDERYELDYAADGLTALHLLATREYDVVVLDVMLPGIDGFSLCRRIRQDLRSPVPVLLLTARDSIEDKSEGFNAGADDYLVKPFAMKELELRIRALQRRTRPAQEQLQRGPLRYDFEQQRIWVGNRAVDMPPSAAGILLCLMRAWPGLVSHEDLAREVWGSSPPDANAVRTHMSSLRRTLKEHACPASIRALYGRGYRLILPGDA